MGTTTITIDVDETTRDLLARAAERAGQSLAAYLTRAATDRMVRDAGAGYPAVVAKHPDLAADVAAARLAAMREAAAIRAKVIAKYAPVDHSSAPTAAVA